MKTSSNVTSSTRMKLSKPANSSTLLTTSMLATSSMSWTNSRPAKPSKKLKLAPTPSSKSACLRSSPRSTDVLLAGPRAERARVLVVESAAVEDAAGAEASAADVVSERARGAGARRAVRQVREAPAVPLGLGLVVLAVLLLLLVHLKVPLLPQVPIPLLPHPHPTLLLLPLTPLPPRLELSPPYIPLTAACSVPRYSLKLTRCRFVDSRLSSCARTLQVSRGLADKPLGTRDAASIVSLTTSDAYKFSRFFLNIFTPQLFHVRLEFKGASKYEVGARMFPELSCDRGQILQSRLICSIFWGQALGVHPLASGA
ncbi:hypothetical protein FA13DRAFT_1913843 [Coprinellus micaceus]|uniref:Uncharacterized protein n=1 Tax=Coprinellus micaceus TaxID=71717 RepID=A0A4Y7SP69_COPMI|nr:hypothetical protein FA13DRAFT_1913843 [Coprinellus micaceus]